MNSFCALPENFCYTVKYNDSIQLPKSFCYTIKYNDSNNKSIHSLSNILNIEITSKIEKIRNEKNIDTTTNVSRLKKVIKSKSRQHNSKIKVNTTKINFGYYFLYQRSDKLSYYSRIKLSDHSYHYVTYGKTPKQCAVRYDEYIVRNKIKGFPLNFPKKYPKHDAGILGDYESNYMTIIDVKHKKSTKNEEYSIIKISDNETYFVDTHIYEKIKDDYFMIIEDKVIHIHNGKLEDLSRTVTGIKSKYILGNDYRISNFKSNICKK